MVGEPAPEKPSFLDVVSEAVQNADKIGEATRKIIAALPAKPPASAYATPVPAARQLAEAPAAA